MAIKVVNASLTVLTLLIMAMPAHALPADAQNDLAIGIEGGQIAGGVFGNDSPMGSIQIISNTTPTNGVGFGIDVSTGLFTFDPLPQFSGTVSFDYTIRENHVNCVPVVIAPDCDDSARAVLFVAPVADVPSVSSGPVLGTEDTAIPLGLGITLIDNDGSETSVLGIGNLPSGSVLSAGTQQPDESWILTPGQVAGVTLTPPLNYNGTINVNLLAVSQDTAMDPAGQPVVVQDSGGGGFTVNVQPDNDDPTLVGPIPAINTVEDVNASVNLAGVVDDIDGDTITYTVLSVSNPAVSLADFTGSSLNVTVAANQSGSGTVRVRGDDGNGGAPVDFDVPVDVAMQNDDPFTTGVTVTFNTNEDVSGSIDLSTMVDDVDIATDADSLTYLVDTISSSAVSSASMAGSVLNVTVATDQNQLGGGITVEVSDSFGGTPLTLNVPVNVAAVNDDPFLAGSIPSLDTDEDVPDGVDLVGVVDDVDIVTNADALSYNITSIDNAAVASAVMSGSKLAVTLVPDSWELGGSITVEVTDGFGGAPIDLVVPVNVSAINDLPLASGSVANVDVPEDSPDEVIDFSGVFSDVDIATGDSLTLSAALDSGDAIFDTISVSGSEVTLSFAQDANGNANVLVEATDNAGETVPYVLNVNLQAVNDAPEADGVLGNRAIEEDDPPEFISLVGAFSDVDGDVLSYEIFDVEIPELFTDTSIVGDSLILTLFPDANGVTDITVIARDPAGASSPGITFTVTVNGVDDFPDADDDTVAGITEDSGEVRIDVLANDYLAEQPTVIAAIVDIGTHDVLDENGDIVPTADGSVRIEGNEVVFTPTENFWGDATFQYSIRDADGDEDNATVTISIDPVNDPPVNQQTHLHDIVEGNVLEVYAFEGLLLGAYDIDPSLVDGDGNPIIPQTLSVVFETAPPPAEGTLLSTASDGSFIFRPAAGFIGTTEFTYTVFDNALKSEVGVVSIEVIALPPVGAAPNPGEVAVLFNLANTPLEQSTSVQPNVLVSMDDSGSMDWHITADTTDDNGRFVINNNSIATSGRRSRNYSYLFDLSVNSYGTTSGNGRVLPSEESLPAGNDYNVWQGRSAAFNNIYYDPEVTYEPWAGLDNASVDFADAVPTAIRLDPMSSSNTYDITTLKSYLAHSVPNWASGGGSANITVNNFYIPRYYTAAGVLVEIRDDATTYIGGPERDDCAANDGTCTGAEELQNFANWFQYYRSRELVAKAALGGVVAELQDIRVGYETINRRSNEAVAEMNEYYWEGEKRELLDEIYDTNSSGSTPLRRALDDAGRILGCNYSGRGCPSLPAPEGICQQNFSLLFSDGYWNGSTPRAGNFDQDGAGIFDGGKFADTHSNTLADIAMHFYETDMFPAYEDGVPLSTADVEGVPADTYESSSDFIHQHMKTFTIAFGVEPDVVPADAESALATASFDWPQPSSAPNAKIDDMLHAAINGRGRFLNAGSPQELSRAVGSAFREFTQAASSSSAAAFNSTSLREGTLLYRGFYDLRNRTGELTATVVSTDGIISGTPTWTAAELLDPTTVGGLLPSERVLFTYDPSDSSGMAFQYNQLTPDQQLTLSENEVNFIRGERTFEEPGGTLRQRLDEEGLLGDIVNSSPVFVGEARGINRDQAPFPTDDLYSEWVADVSDRQKMVYVGANDGMLHGFDALNGTEVMGYIPNAVMDSTQPFTSKLNAFTSAFYLHDYFVDLSPRLNDIYARPNTSSAKQWLTTLVGGLGAGGKSFFALNVTDPGTQFADESSAKGSVMWEFSENDDTYPLDVSGDPIGGAVDAITDPLGRPVKDMGYSLSLPVITMSNKLDTDSNNEWVALFGNGTNSTSGIATLFLLFIDKGLDGWQSGDFVKISTGFGVPLAGEPLEGYPNALGSPTAVDKDLNGTVDLVYAGDRLGNLYRFEVDSPNTANWQAVRLFTASYDDGSGTDTIQPILSKPLVTKHPDKDGFLITFGTGSFITEEDGGNTDIQSVYTIWDPLLSNPPTANSNTKETRLVEQELTNVVDDSLDPAQTRRILSRNSVTYEAESATPGVYGWYVDFDMERAEETLSGADNLDISGNAPPAVQFPGEKAIRRFIFRDGVILTTTVLPATNATSCFGSRPGAILLFDALTGGDPQEAVVDFNVDGYVDENDLLDVEGLDYSAGLVFDHSQLDGQLVDLSTLGGEGDTDFLFICGGNECLSRRIRDLNDSKTGRLSWTTLQQE